jgi:8-oxo-dGTP pyrophosphatase MutT (NUDIX family)
MIKSYGIICFGLSKQNELCVLMVHKRHTNNFMRFITGQYNNADDGLFKKLVKDMTVEEQMDIMTCDFNTLWRKVYGYGKPQDWNDKRYIFAKMKYNSKYKHCNKTRVHRMIRKSIFVDQPVELPKGRREKNETPYTTAKREFVEETSLSLGNFNILKEVFIEGERTERMSYAMMFFIGTSKISVNPGKVKYKNTLHKNEIVGVEWIRVCDLETYNIDNIYIDYIKEAINELSKYNESLLGSHKDKWGANNWSRNKVSPRRNNYIYQKEDRKKCIV